MLKGFFLNFSDAIDQQANADLQRMANSLIAQLIEGITDILPAYRNLYIEYDSCYVTEEEVRTWIDTVNPRETQEQQGRQIRIEVNYNGEDLEDISAKTGLSIQDIIKKHTEKSYHVYAIGFSSGLPFMAEVDEAIRLPRKAIPRMKVPAHSVAIANMQTTVYPISTPGGWNLIGKTTTPIFDPHREEAFLLQAGDQVNFVPSQKAAAPEIKKLELLPEQPKHPVFRVIRAGLQDLLLDEGRFMSGRFGLGRAGALDAPLAKLANQLVGNQKNDVFLELTLTGPELELLEDTVIAVTGTALLPILNNEELESFRSYALKKGDVLKFKPTTEGARSYLAVSGGFESKTFMGSASVDEKGYIGRALASGDILGRASLRKVRAGRAFLPYAAKQDTVRLRITEGPQSNPDALSTLTANAYTVASASRMGIRFEGAEVAGGGIISEAVPIGAVQITSGGMPILLLNDRGTLGGYEKPAIVHPKDLPKAAQLRPGQKVKFIHAD